MLWAQCSELHVYISWQNDLPIVFTVLFSQYCFHSKECHRVCTSQNAWCHVWPVLWLMPDTNSMLEAHYWIIWPWVKCIHSGIYQTCANFTSTNDIQHAPIVCPFYFSKKNGLWILHTCTYHLTETELCMLATLINSRLIYFIII